MKRTLWTGCLAVAAASTLLAAGGLAHAEEGRELGLSDQTVTVGRGISVSGDGCEASPSWIRVRVGIGDQVVQNGEDGSWSAEFQMLRTEGEIDVNATCGTGEEAWSYAPTSVTVVPEGDLGSVVEPRLSLRHPVVTAGYGVEVRGTGCISDVEVRVGDDTRTAHPTTTGWMVGFSIPEDVLGEVPVSATCTGDDPFTYPETTLTVVADGNLGIPPLPNVGCDNDCPPQVEPTQEAAPSTKPGLPSAGL